MLSIFWCAFCLFWRNDYLNLKFIFDWVFFFFLILSCMSCLYILGINLLPLASSANTFFWGLSFCFVYGFFCCAKDFTLNLIHFGYHIEIMTDTMPNMWYMSVVHPFLNGYFHKWFHETIQKYLSSMYYMLGTVSAMISIW